MQYAYISCELCSDQDQQRIKRMLLPQTTLHDAYNISYININFKLQPVTVARPCAALYQLDFDAGVSDGHSGRYRANICSLS